MATTARWTEAETKRALFLYFQLPFGQLHRKNSEIIALAASLSRTPSSVAMKLANFASLDPKIVESGRKGLAGASALDRQVWNEFNADWTKLIVESASHESGGGLDDSKVRDAQVSFRYEPPEGATTVRTEIERRVGQTFFRRAVLANFENTCAVTGIEEPRLLVASHISPWKDDAFNRHNPRNGLCLSATFDLAFDKLLLTVLPDFTIRLSSQLTKGATSDTRAYFGPYEGRKLRTPTHLTPDPAFLTAHNERFLP
ncbi:HNH endonuclease [Sphingomonas sp. ST-64]|uniref:HNH endonuclease n=1 Tax=Sphingomonas plantiphila TaxID=3163295 RepID=A0ABW8YNH6_9SPHN